MSRVALSIVDEIPVAISRDRSPIQVAPVAVDLEANFVGVPALIRTASNLLSCSGLRLCTIAASYLAGTRDRFWRAAGLCALRVGVQRIPSIKTSTKRNTLACQPGWSCM
jgi:hypothetical protein